MKRIVAIPLIGAVAVALAGVGLAWARPDLMPSWARLAARPRRHRPTRGCTATSTASRRSSAPSATRSSRDRLLLCKEHGDIPEDICTLCHPEVKEKYRIKMCPRSTACPSTSACECGKGPSASLDLPDDGWCATHNLPEALCAECAEEPRPIGPGAAGAAGVDLGVPPALADRPARLGQARPAGRHRDGGRRPRRTHAHTLSANAETAYDANHYAEISPRVGGFLREVRVDLGQAVRQGEVLAVVDSAEVGAAKTQYLSAQAAARARPGRPPSGPDRSRSPGPSPARPSSRP